MLVGEKIFRVFFCAFFVGGEKKKGMFLLDLSTKVLSFS